MAAEHPLHRQPAALNYSSTIRTRGESAVSIVRIGLSESKNYSAGYDAIFAKKKPAAKKPTAGKKPAAKKKAAKKK